MSLLVPNPQLNRPQRPNVTATALPTPDAVAHPLGNLVKARRHKLETATPDSPIVLPEGLENASVQSVKFIVEEIGAGVPEKFEVKVGDQILFRAQDAYAFIGVNDIAFIPCDLIVAYFRL